MKRSNTTKRTSKQDFEVRLALTEQGFDDIKTRLNLIEDKMEVIRSRIDSGFGAWRGVMAIGGFTSMLLGIFEISNFLK